MATSYVPPIIEVYQEFAAAGAISDLPLLQSVVVGPSYHILTYARDKSEISVGDYNKATGNTFLAPAALPGMKLQSTNLAVYFDDASVAIESQADGVFVDSVPTSDIVTSALSDYVTQVVKVGDDVTVTGSTLEYKVLAVVDANTLQLNRNLDIAAGTGLTVAVTRKVDDRLLDDSFVDLSDIGINTVTVNLGATLLEDALVRNVESAKMYLEYKALDVTYANTPAEISSTDDIENKLGVVSGDDNPLAMGAFVMFNNSQRKLFAIALESDDTVGWSKAADEAKKRGFYAKALLTDDLANISLFKTVEIANAEPQTSVYGLSFGTHKVEDLEELEVSSGTAGETLTDGTIIVLQDNTADFIADDVLPGDSINMVGTLASGNPYLVDSVVNANKIKILPSSPFASEESGQTYTIDRLLDEEQLAERIAAVSESLKYKRVIMCFPDSCQIAGEKLPGYYTTCVVAGFVAGLPPNAGLTFKGASVIEKVFNSNFKFDEGQLNIIAGGGTLIFVQDDEASLPYIRHQLTTDRTTLESSEISMIKNNDYVSTVFKSTMKKFLGIYNVQEGLFITLRPALDADIAALEASVSTELGPILISASIVELKQSDTNKDQIEAVIETVQPAPFNKGILRVIA